MRPEHLQRLAGLSKHALLAAAMAKFVLSPSDPWASCAALALVLAYQTGRRYLAQARKLQADAERAKVAALETEVKQLANVLNMRNLRG